MDLDGLGFRFGLVGQRFRIGSRDLVDVADILFFVLERRVGAEPLPRTDDEARYGAQRRAGDKQEPEGSRGGQHEPGAGRCQSTLEGSGDGVAHEPAGAHESEQATRRGDDQGKTDGDRSRNLWRPPPQEEDADGADGDGDEVPPVTQRFPEGVVQRLTNRAGRAGIHTEGGNQADDDQAQAGEVAHVGSQGPDEDVVSPGCLIFGRRDAGLRRDGPFLAGGRRRAGVRVRVATVATTVTAATQATHQPVLALDKALYGLHPPREWREAVGVRPP